ncbi:unnamed protein product, partial [Prorocentrum cordatum]
MSGQHAAVRKRALALRAENVATPGERAGRGRGRAAGPRRGAPFLRTERPWAPAAAVPRAAGSTAPLRGGAPNARLPRTLGLRPWLELELGLWLRLRLSIPRRQEGTKNPRDHSTSATAGQRDVLVARRTQLEARLLVRVLGLVVGLLLRNAHAPHPLLPFLP